MERTVTYPYPGYLDWVLPGVQGWSHHIKTILEHFHWPIFELILWSLECRHVVRDLVIGTPDFPCQLRGAFTINGQEIESNQPPPLEISFSVNIFLMESFLSFLPNWTKWSIMTTLWFRFGQTSIKRVPVPVLLRQRTNGQTYGGSEWVRFDGITQVYMFYNGRGWGCKAQLLWLSLNELCWTSS